MGLESCRRFLERIAAGLKLTNEESAVVPERVANQRESPTCISNATMSASSSSWTHLPPPTETEPLKFEALFTEAEAERLMLGLVPEEMEDKWFIYFEDGWLRFHRSWTGAFIYALRLDRGATGTRVTDSWVNRNSEQYKPRDTEYDRKLVRFLIDAFLLKKSDVMFPMPTDVEDSPRWAVQHHLVGRAYPEAGDSNGEASGTR
jgi:hypothetical protein